jgi:hypothetical protein
MSLDTIPFLILWRHCTVSLRAMDSSKNVAIVIAIREWPHSQSLPGRTIRPSPIPKNCRSIDKLIIRTIQEMNPQKSIDVPSSFGLSDQTDHIVLETQS